MHVSPRIFTAFHRVLLPGGFLRVITPNPRVTMQHYLAGDNNFSLFRRRRHIQHGGHSWTLFELLRTDFLSVSHQSQYQSQPQSYAHIRFSSSPLATIPAPPLPHRRWS